MPIWTARHGHALSYDDQGAGPLVVLLHGSPGTSKAWQRVAERLSGRFRVIAPDLPGYGGTPREVTGAQGDVARTAELIEDLIGALGPPLVVAGHSYGAVVALRIALRDALRLPALALFEPVAVRVLDAMGDADEFASARAVFESYTPTADGADARAIRAMVEYWFGQGAYDRLPAPTKDFILAHAAENARDVRATFREQYSPESIRRLAMPVLVVCGARSPGVMARICGRLAALAPQGSLVTLDDATHAMTATHVEAVAGLIAGLADRAAVARAGS